VYGGKGDQLRARAWLEGLSKNHDMRLVTVEAGHRDRQQESELDALAETIVVRPSGAARAASALGAFASGAPGQVGWMLPRPAWTHVLQQARHVDVALANTARSLRGPLPVPTVVDHIDALSLSFLRRSTGSAPWAMRRLFRLEAERLRRWEHQVASWAAAQLVTTEEDARWLPPTPPPRVVPTSLRAGANLAIVTRERDLDVVLTGNMAYPPNADAAAWLAAEIAPEVRRVRPSTRVVVAGRAAAKLRLAPGVEVWSDVPSIRAVLERAKVAVVPLRIGTGTPNKVLEAMGAGAAVVATPQAVDSFKLPREAVLTADSVSAWRDSIIRLLDSERTRDAVARRAIRELERFDSERQVADLERLLAEIASR
jgi:hypothetical protein